MKNDNPNKITVNIRGVDEASKVCEILRYIQNACFHHAEVEVFVASGGENRTFKLDEDTRISTITHDINGGIKKHKHQYRIDCNG